MRLGDVFSEPPLGHMSLQKTWGNIGGLVLSAGFLRVAWTRDLTFDVFLGYAFALAVVISPALAAKLMGLRYGQTTTTNGQAAKPPGGTP